MAATQILHQITDLAQIMEIHLMTVLAAKDMGITALEQAVPGMVTTVHLSMEILTTV